MQQQPLPTGEQVRRAARSLHDALGRMEQALASRRGFAPAQVEGTDEQLLAQCIELEEQNRQLEADLSAMQERCQNVSQQVEHLSAQLDRMVERVSEALSE